MAAIILVDPIDDYEPLTLDNAILLPAVAKVKMIKCVDRKNPIGFPDGKDGKRWCPIESFNFVEGGSGTEAGGVMKEAGHLEKYAIQRGRILWMLLWQNMGLLRWT